jgi:translation initiation factor 2-alpha kinase 4
LPRLEHEPGKKKLQDLEPELHRLCTIKHPNLLELYAAKLSIRSDPGYGSTRLVLLCEQASPLNLGDVLDDVDGLREEKATDYMKQILGALQALHAAEIPHRGLVLEHIGLAPRDTSITPNANAFNGHGPSTAMSSSSKVVKLACAGWLVRILALHRSTAISPGLPPATSGPGTDDGVPEAWLTRACVDSPLVYTKARDMHGAGMVMMQMLLGRDVYRLYQDPRNALMLGRSIVDLQATGD